MLSKRSSSWKWYDWLVVFFVVVVIVAIVRAAAPGSGFDTALHQGFHGVSLFLAWVGNGLTTLAGLLDQL